MSDNRKEYTVDIGGLEHTVLLTDEEAQARAAVAVKSAPKPTNKARKANDKSA